MMKSRVSHKMTLEFQNPTEEVIYCSPVKKITWRLIPRERTLVLTDQKIYLFKKDSISRIYEYRNLVGLVKSSSNQIILLAALSKNLHFDSAVDLPTLIALIQTNFHRDEPERTLKLYEVPEKNISQYRKK
jgi:hypothetical protein